MVQYLWTVNEDWMGLAQPDINYDYLFLVLRFGSSAARERLCERRGERLCDRERRGERLCERRGERLGERLCERERLGERLCERERVIFIL